MRTTVSIDDELLRAAKDRARAAGQTLGQYLEDAVRRRVLSDGGARGPIHIPVIHGSGGVRAGIDFTSNAGLLEAADDDRP